MLNTFQKRRSVNKPVAYQLCNNLLFNVSENGLTQKSDAIAIMIKGMYAIR